MKIRPFLYYSSLLAILFFFGGCMHSSEPMAASNEPMAIDTTSTVPEEPAKIEDPPMNASLPDVYYIYNWLPSHTLQDLSAQGDYFLSSRRNNVEKKYEVYLYRLYNENLFSPETLQEEDIPWDSCELTCLNGGMVEKQNTIDLNEVVAQVSEGLIYMDSIEWVRFLEDNSYFAVYGSLREIQHNKTLGYAILLFNLQGELQNFYRTRNKRTDQDSQGIVFLGLESGQEHFLIMDPHGKYVLFPDGNDIVLFDLLRSEEVQRVNRGIERGSFWKAFDGDYIGCKEDGKIIYRDFQGSVIKAITLDISTRDYNYSFDTPLYADRRDIYDSQGLIFHSDQLNSGSLEFINNQIMPFYKKVLMKKTQLEQWDVQGNILWTQEFGYAMISDFLLSQNNNTLVVFSKKRSHF